MRGIYNNIEYLEGVKESYVYAYTTESFKDIHPEIDMFNGTKTKNTISRRTLELMLSKQDVIFELQSEGKVLSYHDTLTEAWDEGLEVVDERKRFRVHPVHKKD